MYKKKHHLRSLGVCIELVHQQVVVGKLALCVDNNCFSSVLIFFAFSLSPTHLGEGELCSELFDAFVVGEIRSLLLARCLHFPSQSADLGGQLCHLGPEDSVTTTLSILQVCT